MTPPLVLHLHAHLPECRPARPGGVDFEDWFFEALQGSYLPLLRVFEGWAQDGIAARLSLSLSSPLVSMLQDDELFERARRRWRLSAELASSVPLPEASRRRLVRAFDDAVAQSGDVLGRLRRLEGRVLDLVATGASHGLLPFAARIDTRWAEAQVGLGLARLRQAGFAPVGFWLPECGVDESTAGMLARHRVAFSFVEGARAPGAEGGEEGPFQAPEGPLFFPRSLAVAHEIWHPDHGCPGQGPYREFHRDAGSEAPDLARRVGLPDDGRPFNLKAWAIDGSDYDPARGEALAAADAERFWIRRQAEGRPAVAPFDAELFGHWWFEGPAFLDALARHPLAGPILTAADVLRSGLPLPVRAPRPGTWGQHGFGRTWLGPDNAWIYDCASSASRDFFAGADPELSRLRLPHMLGLMASDWPFLVRAGSYLDAVPRRIQDHLVAMRTPPTTPAHAGLDCPPAELRALEASP